MRLVLQLTAALLPAYLLVPASALAHGSEGPYIDVLSSHVRQGQPFVVVGDDLEPDALAVVEISSFGEVYPLGTVTTDAQGHLDTFFTVPSEMRDGYAEVRATTTGGVTASIWILVGEGPDLSEGLPGGPPESGAPWADPSVLTLAVFLIGATVALVWLLLTRRRELG